MGYWDSYVDVSEMLGQTFSRVFADHDAVTFENDEVRYMLYHDQDCCERVYVEEIVGDLEDLKNLPLLTSREDTNAEDPGTRDYGDDSHTWTFYNFATLNGYVTIRFLGESNGYYSESVSCKKDILNK